MRNGNSLLYQLSKLLRLLFLSYLWGMETTVDEIQLTVSSVLILPMRNGNLDRWYDVEITYTFLSYLWGMETNICSLGRRTSDLFLSYLWGMETMFVSEFSGLKFSSYPTYEEWKRSTLMEYEERRINVLILPMRNGNCGIIYCSGIEIRSYPTYEEWKLTPTAK